MEKRIKQDLYNNPYFALPFFMLYDERIHLYYGTYNGSVVLMIYSSDGGPDSSYYMTKNYSISGINFVERIRVLRLIIWNNGKLVLFENGYDSGLLTRDDLRNISYYNYYNFDLWRSHWITPSR